MTTKNEERKLPHFSRKEPQAELNTNTNKERYNFGQSRQLVLTTVLCVKTGWFIKILPPNEKRPKSFYNKRYEEGIEPIHQ
jgi:hypothetical protein